LQNTGNVWHCQTPGHDDLSTIFKGHFFISKTLI